MPPLALVFLLLLAILAIFVGFALPRLARDPVEARLAVFSGTRLSSLEEIELQQPFSERVIKPLIQRLSSVVVRAQSRRQTQRKKESSLASIQKKLNLAGNPYNWTPTDFLGVKAAGALILGGALFFLFTLAGKPGYALLAGVGGALFGWFIPDLLLFSKKGARQHEITRALPDALDLLVISVEAGLGFDAAMSRLVEKSNNALTREFARAQAEMRVGRPRREALRDVVERTEVGDLANFIGAIVQAEQLGVSVAKVLSIQADQMRTVRRQRAEELAAQAPLKMIPVLALFIFPALCVVILGPIWPTVAAVDAPLP